MEEIRSIQDIQRLLVSGHTDWEQFGNVSVRAMEDLRIFKYTPLAQYEGRWNYFERVSRGLVLNAVTGEVVARPFDKFFNWMEGGRTTRAALIEASEKLDGSLGIGYMWRGQWRVTTRGTLESEQGQWATDFLNTMFDMSDWPPLLTPLWEIIYPENRIVIDYKGREDLALIGARHRETGEDLRFFPHVYKLAHQFGFSLPNFYDFNSWRSALEAREKLSYNEEGFVLRFADGQRFKFKGDRYLEAHKLMTATSFKAVLHAVRDGTLESMIGAVPDEYQGQVREWEAQIKQTVVETKAEIERVFAASPHEADRKTFALWVLEHHKPLASYLFTRLDNKPLEPLIYKTAFKTTDEEGA